MTWLKDTFTCNCCSCIRSVLISVKSLISIASWDLPRTPNNTHNWLVHALSPSLMEISIIALSDHISILSSSWQEWERILPRYQSQRKAKNHPNLTKQQSFTEPASSLSKSISWNCWEDLCTMDKSSQTGELELTLKTKTKRREPWSSEVLLKNSTRLQAMRFWKKTCHSMRKRFWKASFQS